jgi:hypothetical protein
MGTARMPPPPPPALLGTWAKPSSVDDVERLLKAERLIVDFVATADAEQKKTESANVALAKLIERQRMHIRELSGFRRPIVSLIFYRTVRRALTANLEKVDALSKMMSSITTKLRCANAELVVVRDLIRARAVNKTGCLVSFTKAT